MGPLLALTMLDWSERVILDLSKNLVSCRLVPYTNGPLIAASLTYWVRRLILLLFLSSVESIQNFGNVTADSNQIKFPNMLFRSAKSAAQLLSRMSAQ